MPAFEMRMSRYDSVSRSLELTDEMPSFEVRSQEKLRDISEDF